MGIAATGIGYVPRARATRDPTGRRSLHPLAKACSGCWRTQPAAGLNSRTPVPGLQPLNLAAAAAARRLAPTLSGGGEGHDTTLTFSQKHHGGK